MQINFLKQIVEKTAGETSVKIVDLLANKKDINEFYIAKKLELTINQTRNLLYRLSHLGIISSIRKKDKRKGWYIYFWTLNILRSLEILELNKNQELEKMELELKRKKSERFYKCNLCGRELTEESALLTNFECAECGEIYVLADHKKEIELIIKNINRLNKEIAQIKEEREKEQGRKEKKLSRTINKIEKDKKEKRAEAFVKRKRQKTRLTNKINKQKLDKKNLRKLKLKEKMSGIKSKLKSKLKNKKESFKKKIKQGKKRKR